MLNMILLQMVLLVGPTTWPVFLGRWVQANTNDDDFGPPTACFAFDWFDLAQGTDLALVAFLSMPAKPQKNIMDFCPSHGFQELSPSRILTPNEPVC